MKAFRFLAFTLLALFPALATATALSGTMSVGPTGNYASVTAAVAAIQAQSLGGALVLELQSTYVSTVETFPLTIPALNGASATNTVTLRPQSGATGLSITSANTTAATVDLNGAQYVFIDGRPGGAGTVKQLTIANTSTSGLTVRFINGGSNNMLHYLTIQSVSVGVLFSTTTGNGNSNNTIDTCDIRDGASTPTDGILASGTGTNMTNTNTANTVSNCNIFNFYNNNNQDASGIRLAGGNANWTITGNSFYQTASRAGTGAYVEGIYDGDQAPHTITGNFIGGSAPSAGGSAWTTTGNTQAYLFVGIWVRAGITTPASVQGNVIKNISWNSSSNATVVPGVWSGIYLQFGNANIGTVTGNTIGSATGTGSVTVATAGNGGMIFGISSATTGTASISNNTIGSINATGTDTGTAASLTGIEVDGGTVTISGNLLGSTTTAKSLNASTDNSNGSVAQQLFGIRIRTAGNQTVATVSGNTLANLFNSTQQAFSAAEIIGIDAEVGSNTITGNTIFNLTSPSQSTSLSVVGISLTATGNVQTISQNTIYNLTNNSNPSQIPAPNAAVTVTGIYFSGGAGTNLFARNLIYNLTVSAGTANSSVTGMDLEFGSATVQNNMVRLGIDANGASSTGGSQIFGILDNTTSSGRNFYHNSIYVGGTATTGAAKTFAFCANNGVFDNRLDNIFVNNRSNGGATGKHYAVSGAGTSSSNSNIFFADGTGGVLGLAGSTDETTLAAWQAATKQDANSFYVDPLFVNPTGTTTVDLHLQGFTPAESAGTLVASVTDDFDGDIRANLTPVDIGADAGNFTGISYPLLGTGSTANRVLTGWATITDGDGIASGASAPRLYYKKSTDANTFGANTSAANGWKYVVASNSTSPYSFTIDYSIINGGSVSAGNTIQYFVAAQDALGNLSSNPPGVASSGSPAIQNISGSPSAPNSYTIVPSLGGTVTVGSGGNYPTLTGTGGFFAALNAGALSGAVTVTIISDVTETGSVTLSPPLSNDYPASSDTLTIKPDGTTMRTLSGTSAAGLFTLNGADGVTIDGSFGGSGQYLTFRNTNTSTTSSTILFINDASNNTVANSIVEGASTSQALGVIAFSTGSVTGNNNNVITGCQVRDLSNTTGVPMDLIGSTGSSSAVANTGNTISNSQLFNTNFVGIFISSTGNASWTISGNNIYEVNAAANGLTGVSMQGGGTNLISGNSLHDLTSNFTASRPILFNGLSTTTISNNRITAFAVNAATTAVYGIDSAGAVGSTLNVVNNQITLSPSTSVNTTLFGFHDSSPGGVVNLYYNSIVIGGSGGASFNSWASLRANTSTHTSRNNILLNLRTATGNCFAAGNEATGGSFTASNNVYAGTGGNGLASNTYFMDFSGTPGTIGPMPFATWQTSASDINSQAGLAGSGNFTSAMFVNAATGDLHVGAGGNVLIDSLGTPISGITTDYDGDPRNPTRPTIGSDEPQIPIIGVEEPTGTGLTSGVSVVNFGNSAIGVGVPLSFTIRNSGINPLNISGVTITGANSNDFTVTQPPSSSVAVGSSTTLQVTFSPIASFNRFATLQINSNDPINGAFAVNLTGLSPSTLAAAFNSATSVPLSTSALTATGSTVNLSLNFAPSTGTNLTVVKNTGPGLIQGAFSNLAQGQVVNLSFGGNSYRYVANYYGGSGRDLVLQWDRNRLLAWGDDVDGQLGNNGTTSSDVPVAVLASGVLSGKTISKIAVGQGFTIVLCSDGTLASFGVSNLGELGNNGTATSSVPVLVSTSGVLANKTVVAISAGAEHSLALCSDGTLVSWGYNMYGQLGNSTFTNSLVPVLVTTSGVLSGKTVVGIYAGQYYSLALCSDGTFTAWGYGTDGELGNNNTADFDVPVSVIATGALQGKTPTQVVAGGDHVLVLCADGSLVTWGGNAYGQLGNGNTTNSSVPISVNTAGVLAGETIVGLAAGENHSAVLCSDGTIASWGRNDATELGNNSGMNSSLPILTSPVGGLSGKTPASISAGGFFGLALCTDGTAVGWGNNAVGQLGSGSTTVYLPPVAVSTSSLLAGETFVLELAGSTSLHTFGLVAEPPPSVTLSSTSLPINGTTVAINGAGFDPVAANNTVSFNDGVVGTVTVATTTSLTVTFSTAPSTVGSLTAVVTSDGFSSGSAVQVATVVPVVTSSTTTLADNSPTITINGFGFDLTATNNAVTFSDGAVGHVTAATAIQLTVSITTVPTTAGALTASVSTDGASSGTAVQVATVIPVVTSSTAGLADTSGTITINGFGFDPVAGNNAVIFTDGTVGHVTVATPTSLTVDITTMPSVVGVLTASVTTDSLSSGTPVQVANVTPVVTSSTANLPANAPSFTITGIAFDPVAANNTVTLSNGAAGVVTATTTTSLTVGFNTLPTSTGSMTAVVTTDGQSSGVAVQVATVQPAYVLGTATLVEGPASGQDTVTLAVFPASATGTATANASWLHTSASGAGSANVPFTFDANPSFTRTGTLTIGGQTLTVTQAGSTYVPTSTMPVALFASSAGDNNITVDASGNVYYTDTFESKVLEVPANSSSSHFLFSTTPNASQMGIAVDGAGNVYVSNNVTNSIQKWTASTQTLSNVVTTGLLGFKGLALDGAGNLYIADAGNNAIEKWTAATGTVSTLVSTGLNTPQSVALDRAGNVYIADTGNNAVKVWSATTGTVTSLVATGLNAPVGVAADGSGNVFIADANNEEIKKWTAATGVVSGVAFEVGLEPASVTVDGLGNLYLLGSAYPGPSVDEIVNAYVDVSAKTEAPGAGSDAISTVLPSAENLFVPVSDQSWLTIGAISNGVVSYSFTLNNTGANRTAHVIVLGQSITVTQLAPVVDVNTADLAANAPTVIIKGALFDGVAANDSVTFNDGAVGTVSAASESSLTVTFSTLPTTAGSLTAVVTAGGAPSGNPVQVATVTPVVTSSSIAIAGNAATLVINGFGFDPTALNNVITLSNGATGTVSSASPTSLTVTFSSFIIGGDLTAIVTTDGQSSGNATQVAIVNSVVSPSSADLPANAISFTIQGFGFDPVAANDIVTLSNGAVGVITAAAETAVTVTFTTNPTSIGSMTAVVTTDGIASGDAVQVANVVPTYVLAASSLVEGPTASSDTVTLTVTPESETWTASSNASWLHTSASGTGSANVLFNFDANTGATRSGTLTIAGQTFTVTQAGSTYVAANPVTTLVPASAGLNGPVYLALDSVGNVYLSDFRNNAIKKWSVANQSVTTVVPIMSPYGVATDGAGDVYFTSSDSNLAPLVQVWNASAQTTSNVFISSTFPPLAIVLDRAGNIYFIAGSTVAKWTAATGAITTIMTGFGAPVGLALDATGNVYVADWYSGKITKWTAATQTASTLVSEMIPLSGVAVDDGGNVFTADSSGNLIEVWRATTQTVSTIVSSGLNSPEGLAVDANGNLYIADTGNNAIKELSRAFVDVAAKTESPVAGSDSLSPVLPSAENLLAPFAPSSDQTWLTFGAVTGGVVNFNFTANIGPSSRTAHISFLGQTIAVTQSPSFMTATATEITSGFATLNGSVNPNGVATTAYFQYGTGTSYGTDTGFLSLGSGSTAVPASFNINSLAKGRTYHYRLVIISGGTTYFGTDQTFTTSSVASAPAWHSAQVTALTNANLNNMADGARTGAAHATSELYFYKGTDSDMWCVYLNGSAWTQAQLTTNTNVSDWLAFEPNYGALCYQSNDGNLWCVYYSTATAKWVAEQLGTPPQGVTVAGDIVVDSYGGWNNIYYRGSDSHMYAVYLKGSTWTHVSLGGTATVKGNLAVEGNNHLVYYQGTDNNIWCFYYTGKVWEQVQLSTTANVGGTVAVDSAGLLVYYKALTDNSAWCTYPVGGTTWTPVQLDASANMSASATSFSNIAPYNSAHYNTEYLDGNGQCDALFNNGSKWGHSLLGDGGFNLTGGLSLQPVYHWIFARRSDGNVVIFYNN